MKYILAISNTWDGFSLEVFQTKEDLMNYLLDGGWELNSTVDWTNLESYTGVAAEYIAYQIDSLGRITEVHLRVVPM